MDQVGSVCACSRSQSLALPGEKALPVGYPDRRDSRICNRKLFGGALMQRRTAVTMRQDANVSQQHFAPISRLFWDVGTATAPGVTSHVTRRPETHLVSSSQFSEKEPERKRCLCLYESAFSRRGPGWDRHSR